MVVPFLLLEVTLSILDGDIEMIDQCSLSRSSSIWYTTRVVSIVMWPVVILSVLLSGCSLSDLVQVNETEIGQEIARKRLYSAEGARGVYYSAIEALQDAVSLTSRDVGFFTDELGATSAQNSTVSRLDVRDSSSSEQYGAYSNWHEVRIRSKQASELLLRYTDQAEYPLVGNAYALQGYSILMLAKNFCSGIPLTDVLFEGDLLYTRGFSTEELLRTSIALFDTAYMYGKDSLPVATLARVGKGEALLDLGEFIAAEEVMRDISIEATYKLDFSATQGINRFWTIPTNSVYSLSQVVSAEGENGIVWIADTARHQDPRVRVTRNVDSTMYLNPLKFLKFPTGAVNTSVTLADGVHARLIAAEAQLSVSSLNGDPLWLRTLNEARASLIGVGGVRLLPDTVDPGNQESRVNLLFRERAFWLYLTGQRLGDLRRLVREYDKSPFEVYPVGFYDRDANALGYKAYGSAWVFRPPNAERGLNPYYEGCAHENP